MYGAIGYGLYLIYPDVKDYVDNFKFLQSDETVPNHDSFGMAANWTNDWNSSWVAENVTNLIANNITSLITNNITAFIVNNVTNK